MQCIVSMQKNNEMVSLFERNHFIIMISFCKNDAFSSPGRDGIYIRKGSRRVRFRLPSDGG